MRLNTAIAFAMLGFLMVSPIMAAAHAYGSDDDGKIVGKHVVSQALDPTDDAQDGLSDTKELLCDTHPHLDGCRIGGPVIDWAKLRIAAAGIVPTLTVLGAAYGILLMVARRLG